MFNLIDHGGVWAVFLLMLVENLIPIIPSELILPLAGLVAANGRFDPVSAIVAATIGSMLGGSAWYAVSRWYGLRRLRQAAGGLGRWIPFSEREIQHLARAFGRWDAALVCLGRALPGVRGVICIPAGVVAMPVGRFVLWSSLGAFLWSSLLFGAGYWLHANQASVARWSSPVADGVLGLAVAAYLVRVATYRRPRI